MTDFTKEFFQTAWGEKGYYENFSYGVGIEKVCEVALYPFMHISKEALEIGSGGGVFTERVINKFWEVTVLDVIRMPERFKAFNNFRYIEVQNQSYTCPLLEDNYFDFCFSYNVFCHLSNQALTEYLKNINRVLKQGADFVFMLANYEHTKKHLIKDYQLGEMTPIGHFVQDERTLKVIAGKEWEIINPNMIPEHRDIVIHLKKK